MNSDIFLLGDLWFLLLLVLESSASAATVFDFHTLTPLSLSLCNASPRISIRLLGERVSAGCFPGRRHMWIRRAKTRGREMERIKGRGVHYISIPKRQGHVGVEWEVIYILSHADSSFTPALFAGAGWSGLLLCWSRITGRSTSNVSPRL